MAATLKIGTAADYSGGTCHDLLDQATAGNVFLVLDGWSSAKKMNNQMLESMRCIASSATHANIIAKEKTLREFIEDAIEFLSNEGHDESEAIWLYENADGETAKRALVMGGSLERMGMLNLDPLLHRNAMYYQLSIERHPLYEAVAEVTGLNAQAMSYAAPIVSITSVKGEVLGRISELIIRGGSTNTEADPLYDVFIGIHTFEEYDPVWELENAGTLGTDTAVTNDAGGNTSPSGSSTANRLTCSFGTTTTDAKRATISLKDFMEATNLLTNPGAESGSTTGWTVTGTCSLSASTAEAVSGTYSFEGTGTIGAKSGTLYQDVAVTAGLPYTIEGWCIDGVTAGANISYQWRTSGGAVISTVYPEYIETGEVGAAGTWKKFRKVDTAPVTAATLRLILSYAKDTMVEPLYFDDLGVYLTDYSSWRGKYMVLLRHKLSAAGEVDAYMRFGYGGTNPREKFPSQTLSGTNWKLTPLGIVQFPPERMISTVDTHQRISQLTIDIYAERVSGTPSLYMDCLIFIPANHFLRVEGCSVAKASTQNEDSTYSYSDLEVYTMPYDDIVVLAEDENFLGINTAVKPSIRSWAMPTESTCYLVCYAQTEDEHVLADAWTVTLKYFPRYRYRNTD